MPFRSLVSSLLIPFVALAVAGCGGPADKTETTGTGVKDPGKGDKPNGAATPALPELTGTVELTPATWEQVQAKMAENKGKVIVLDIWSNWCEPCMKEFPNLVNLQRAHQEDVVCMSLNTNFAGLTKELSDEDKSKALDFLKEMGAKYPNFICSDTDETLYGQIPITSVPTVLVYDREGMLAKKFDEDIRTGTVAGFSYKKHVTPYVEELVKGKP